MAETTENAKVSTETEPKPQKQERTQAARKFLTPMEKYKEALQRLETLRAKREELSGKANQKKRKACNKKIKNLEEKLVELEAKTSVKKDLEFRIQKLKTVRETLTGAANKKKRAATNKKIKNLEKQLNELNNGPGQNADGEYDPPIPDDWLTGYPVNPERDIRLGELKQYEERLKALGAKKLCSTTSVQLKNECGITNGTHRKWMLTILSDLKDRIDWLPKMKEPLFKQTIEYGDGCTYPQDGDTIFVLYKGTLRAKPDNTFDENQNRQNPFHFKVGAKQVIRGWDEGLKKLTLREKARLSIRSDYAYGSTRLAKIPAHSDLVFEVELLDIMRDGVKLEPGHELRRKAELKAEAERKAAEEKKAKEPEDQDGDDSESVPDGDSAEKNADVLKSLPISYSAEKNPSLVLHLPNVPKGDGNYLTEPLLRDKGKLQEEIMAKCGCKIGIISRIQDESDHGMITVSAEAGQEGNILKAANQLLSVFNPLLASNEQPTVSLKDLTAKNEDEKEQTVEDEQDVIAQGDSTTV